MRWYKQNCNLFERPWAKDAKMVSVYAYLHCHAYVQDGRLHGQIVRRGSCPTSRSAIMEGTGLSEHDVKLRLRKLLQEGEIILNSSNLGTIITLCDYDAYSESESLFDDFSSSQSPNEAPANYPTKHQPTTQPIYNKTEDNKTEDNLISPYSPYKQERENSDVALEVKKRYNEMFKGVLPPCIRLSTSTRIAVEECLRRFGLQSVDVVFAQIKTEQFSLGNNKTGFIANFTFIFTLKNYQQYLERAQLARQRQVLPKPQAKQNVGKSIFEETIVERQSRREFLMHWVDEEAKEPSKHGQELLQACYNSGELEKFGIDWKPNNINEI